MTRKLLAAILLALAVGMGITPAFAHAFGETYTLPIPLNFFLIGGAATVALSFVVIGLFVKKQSDEFDYPRYDLLSIPILGAVISSPIFLTLVKLISVGFFVLTISTGLFGTGKPVENFSPTFIWIVWWVGMGYIAAIFGNLWMVINPWKVTFEWFERLAGRDSRQGDSALFGYPQNWDVWPAMLAFLIFAWLENVYTGAVIPFQLSVLILLYSLFTWGGMLAFGKHTWLRHGEGFSVLFGYFSRFSLTEVRISDNRLCNACGQECNLDGQACVDCYECLERVNKGQRKFNIRPFAVGLALPGRVSTATAAFVILALATVTFDGLQETSTWVILQSNLFSLISGLGSNTIGTFDTMGLIFLPLIFLGAYMLFSWGIKALSRDEGSVSDVARAFVFSLVPIALAYNLAHFISLLLIQGQLIIPLASDPFGFGWNLLGTADYKVNIGIINAKTVWFLSVGAIVIGHIISVYIAHVISLRRVANHSLALRGQYPMLLLMVLYTASSLWIIAQPIVES